tara:strand:+ start:60 stop:629 length:570 start_codon:yes stop_codon:yes gene_type:complete
MDSIKLRFTDKMIEKIKSKIPENIKQKYVTDTDVAYKYGAIRFDSGKLNAIYVWPNGPEPSDSWFAVLLKFDVVGDNIVFKYVYDFLEDGDDNTFIEGRYDAELNLESKYTHFDDRVPVKNTDGKLYCKKEIDGENINYLFGNKPKMFLEQLKFLKDNEIIKNDKNNYFCWYGEKQDLDVIYLVINEYS